MADVQIYFYLFVVKVTELPSNYKTARTFISRIVFSFRGLLHSGNLLLPIDFEFLKMGN